MTRLFPAALVLSAALAVFGPNSASAQEVRSLDGAAPAAASIDAFRGLAGSWVGPAGAAAFSAPTNGQIVGYLMLAQVEELWILRQEGPTVTLRQKIFGADLAEREDKDKFEVRPLVGLDAGHLYMENTTFEPAGDSLTIVARFPGQNGAAPHFLRIELKRAK
ncbi:MAG TPA: DUF6265 family protein [Caulobacteraceae bacterium]|jgi:hypothetical protein|nr:DUF6265 family protein [Caulobacteraceae bacterium]